MMNYKVSTPRITTYVADAYTKKFWSFGHCIYKDILVETLHEDLKDEIPNDSNPSDHIPLIYRITID